MNFTEGNKANEEHANKKPKILRALAVQKKSVSSVKSVPRKRKVE